MTFRAPRRWPAVSVSFALAISVPTTPQVSAQRGATEAGSQAKWDVTQPRGVTREIDFTTSEGTRTAVDVAPDGSWVAFDLLGHVHRVPAAGGEAQLLTQNSGVALNFQPRISPDGTTIAFITDRGGQYGARFLGADRDLGSLEVGKLADLMVLNANPLEDIRATIDASYVMKGGVLYDAVSLDQVWPRSVPLGPHYWVNEDALQMNVKGTDAFDGGAVAAAAVPGPVARREPFVYLGASRRVFSREVSMSMESEAEAFACVAVMVAGADGIGTVEEGHYLFDTMAKHPLFRELDPAAFTDVLSRASRHVYTFGRAADGHLSDEGVSTVLDQVRAMLSAELCEQALQMAFDLARSDEMAAEEESLVQRIRQALLPLA